MILLNNDAWFFEKKSKNQIKSLRSAERYPKNVKKITKITQSSLQNSPRLLKNAAINEQVQKSSIWLEFTKLMK